MTAQSYPKLHFWDVVPALRVVLVRNGKGSLSVFCPRLALADLVLYPCNNARSGTISPRTTGRRSPAPLTRLQDRSGMLSGMLPGKISQCVGIHLLLGIALTCAVSASCGAEETPWNVDQTDAGVTLRGPWQFHLGDDPKWSRPETPDSAGKEGWEQIDPDRPWGAQGHRSYTGYAWYRRHIHLPSTSSASPDLALLIQHVDDAYEIYWNGTLIGHSGTLPPRPIYYSYDTHTFGLGPARDGVLALRVWKAPLGSDESSRRGGLYSAPLIGSPATIAARKAELDYTWIRARQYGFGMRSLYGLVMLLSLLAWLRDRSRRVLFWMAVFSGAYVANFFLNGLQLPFPFSFVMGWLQPVEALENIGLWFLLLYLLKLDTDLRLVRITRLLAIFAIVVQSLDGALLLFDWSNPILTSRLQFTDAVLTAIFAVPEFYPLLLVALALFRRLDATRWLVAVAVFLDQMIAVAADMLQQGSRFTQWTLGRRIHDTIFTINGNNFTARTITDTLLFLALIYAVYRYTQEAARRQNMLEQEFQSARELQHVLIPEALPSLTGFAVTSAYRPAREVGGDFFQILPLDGKHAGSALILLGDVSGKGLKAALTVSLIVGMIRTLAETTSSPAEMLAGLNRRLEGRLRGGFVTCIALRMDAGGNCAMAGAGHPPPFLNGKEVALPGALPLGLSGTASYEEIPLRLNIGDHFVLYTDGLLEARGAKGEIFGFERLNALFAISPDAAQAAEAAVNFGQDDDITVLTFTRLAVGEESTTRLDAPVLSPRPPDTARIQRAGDAGRADI